jgi:hypothetical protein|tara:strand:+ start:94 stop:432 length:339 start_codon:yes stop_codon:yes gene_type:complete
MSITLEEAKSKIKNVSGGKVAAAYKLARERKASGRLNVDDVRRALQIIEGTRHPSKAKDSVVAETGMRGQLDKAKQKYLKDLKKVLPTKNKTGGVIKRRGGGIAKRGFGIAK